MESESGSTTTVKASAEGGAGDLVIAYAVVEVVKDNSKFREK